MLRRWKDYPSKKETKYIYFIKTSLLNDQTINWTSKNLDLLLLYIKFQNIIINYHYLKRYKFTPFFIFLYSNLYQDQSKYKKEESK